MWYEKFDKVIKSNGYKVSDADKCIYTKFIDGRGVIICLYVDDMVTFGIDTDCARYKEISFIQIQHKGHGTCRCDLGDQDSEDYKGMCLDTVSLY